MADRPEARIPCPQCGGAIHPVAGKCKHCKADLAALRVGKPQAQAALPKLAATPPVVHPPATSEELWARPRVQTPPPPGPPVPPSTVHAAYAGSAPMRAIDHASAKFSAHGSDDSGPVQILPPRPTGRMFAAAPAPRWPLVVIAISVIAILLSIGALAR